MKLGNLIMSFVLAALCAGCASQKIQVSNESRTLPSYEKSQDFFISGLGQSQSVSAREVCGDGKVTMIETKQTFVDGLLGVITLGIYTPRTVAIFCKEGEMRRD